MTTVWTFNARSFPGYYDAKTDVRNYNLPQVIKDIPKIWNRKYAQDIRKEFSTAFRQLGGRSDETYGALFKRVDAALSVDPYALATYSVFESYDLRTHSFNPHMKHVAGKMYAAGMTATQVQIVKGTLVPGTQHRLPSNMEKAAQELRASPEYAVRYLASEFKRVYTAKKDLALTFPYVAYPAWKNPKDVKGAYGNQSQYVSRAFALYTAFRHADGAQLLQGYIRVPMPSFTW